MVTVPEQVYTGCHEKEANKVVIRLVRMQARSDVSNCMVRGLRFGLETSRIYYNTVRCTVAYQGIPQCTTVYKSVEQQTMYYSIQKYTTVYCSMPLAAFIMQPKHSKSLAARLCRSHRKPSALV